MPTETRLRPTFRLAASQSTVAPFPNRRRCCCWSPGSWASLVSVRPDLRASRRIELTPREPLAIERSVPPVLVHLQQRPVDLLAQRTAVCDGDTIVLRREDRAHDLQFTVAAPSGQVLKRRRVEDHGLELAFENEI